jgi:nicotinamide riboside transporter PnuC
MWSWVLASIGIFGVYLTTSKKVAGFAVGLGAQVLWITYGVTTKQYGFVMSAIGFGSMNVLGLYRWTRPKEKVDDL